MTALWVLSSDAMSFSANVRWATLCKMVLSSAFAADLSPRRTRLIFTFMVSSTKLAVNEWTKFYLAFLGAGPMSRLCRIGRTVLRSTLLMSSAFPDITFSCDAVFSYVRHMSIHFRRSRLRSCNIRVLVLPSLTGFSVPLHTCQSFRPGFAPAN